MEKRKGTVLFNSLMDQFLLEVSVKGKWKGQAKRLGRMAQSLKANGKTIKWMVAELTTGLMVETMKGIGWQENVTVLESTNGQMVESTLALGVMENKMAEASLPQEKTT